WAGQQFHGVAFLEAAGRVETQPAIDAGLARGDQAAYLVPRTAGQMGAEDGGKGSAVFLLCHGESHGVHRQVQWSGEVVDTITSGLTSTSSATYFVCSSNSAPYCCMARRRSSGSSASIHRMSVRSTPSSV